MASGPEENGSNGIATEAPVKRYTRGSASNAPAKKRQSGQKPEKATMVRRRNQPAPDADEQGGPRVLDGPESPKTGGRLRSEILLPLAVGTFAAFAALGI